MNKRSLFTATLLLVSVTTIFAQVRTADQQAGSQIAKNGFRNEAEIAAKFNNWKNDGDARSWLQAMDHSAEDVRNVRAERPHGEKADLFVTVTTATGEKREGISIKLVSNTAGFNQIDKRWLAQYVKKWNIPADVNDALRLFTGEAAPIGQTRDGRRMFLNELPTEQQAAVVDFFTKHKDRVVKDLIAGSDYGHADWFMVALKASEKPQWSITTVEEAISFFGEGEVRMTSGGNLRIGRITMQRKGGDGGRDTAKMLQFKINPAEIFSRK